MSKIANIHGDAYTVSVPSVMLKLVLTDAFIITNTSADKNVVIDELIIATEENTLIQVQFNASRDANDQGDKIEPVNRNRKFADRKAGVEAYSSNNLMLDDEGVEIEGTYLQGQNSTFKEKIHAILSAGQSMSVQLKGDIGDLEAYVTVKFHEEMKRT